MKEALLTIGIAALAVTLLFGSAALKWGFNTSSDEEEELGPIESRPKVEYTPLAESQRFHGLALQIHNYDDLPRFKEAINEIADLGGDTVLLSVAAYQDNGSSSAILVGARRAPNQAQFLELIKLAKSRKLRVIVMPIVLLANPRGNEWRGKIIPDDPDMWWAEYREYIDFYAKPAHEGGADLLIIGSELNRMEDRVSRWVDLINHVRAKFKGLPLSYSANWDRYWKVKFWKHLDYAGVTSYYDLARHDDPTPTVKEITDAWEQFVDKAGRKHRYKDKLIAWQQTIGKPVIFTELGWYSRKGVAMEPWNYYRETDVSLAEQANLYQAFMDVWKGNDVVGGFIFWEWVPTDSNYDPAKDGSYTPKGKPAEKIIRDYFQSLKKRPATAPEQ